MLENPKAGIEAYKKYLAVRNHFKTSYDFFKYAGKVNVRDSTYLKRNDKIFFQKAEKKYKGDLIDLFVSNFVEGNEYIKDIVSDGGERNLAQWKKREEAPEYHVMSDIEEILLESEDGLGVALRGPGHPLVLRMYLGGRINVHTVCVLDLLSGFLNNVSSDSFTDEYVNFIKKVEPFVRFDKKKMASRILHDSKFH